MVVGSTLKTDIELANGGGMKSLLVLSNQVALKRRGAEKNLKWFKEDVGQDVLIGQAKSKG